MRYWRAADSQQILIIILAGWVAGCLAGWLADWLAGWPASQAGWLAGQRAGWLAGWLAAGWLDFVKGELEWNEKESGFMHVFPGACRAWYLHQRAFDPEWSQQKRNGIKENNVSYGLNSILEPVLYLLRSKFLANSNLLFLYNSTPELNRTPIHKCFAYERSKA